jgi:PAS domain S-box-containing protein
LRNISSPISAEHQTITVDNMRAVVTAANDLTACPDVDTICRLAVELARDRFGAERCAIFIMNNHDLCGTFGVDMRGQTTDERARCFPISERWTERLDSMDPHGPAWTVDEDVRYEWVGEKAVPVDEGWIGITPIRSAHKLIGIFVNDAAISQGALNPMTQEILAVYCSLLGTVIERKQAEIALAEERNLLRTLIDNLPDYVYAKDTQCQLIISNDRLADLVGAESPEQLIGKTDFELFPHEQAASFFEADQKVIQSGEPLINHEEMAVDKDGNVIWGLTSKIPLRDSQGRIIGLVGLSRDVTQLKQAQDALEKTNEVLEQRVQERVSELEQSQAALQAQIAERQRAEESLSQERNLLRTLVDALPDYIFAKDVDGRFLISNVAHAQAVGVGNPAEFNGKMAADFFPAELAAQYDADDREVMRRGRPLVNIERRTMAASGDQIVVATTKVPLRDEDGQVVGVVGISRDITDYKLAQEALEHQQEFLRQVIDANPNLIYVKDWEGRFTLVNKAVAELVGTTPEAMIGKRDADFVLDTDELEQIVRTDREVMTTLQPRFISEEKFTNAHTGIEEWYQTIKVPLPPGDGEALSMLSVAANITERKKAEVALRENDLLRIALEKERELNSLKTRLMTTISHEFRTPLAIALSSVGLLEDYFERLTPEKRGEHLVRIHAQINRLTEMIDDISFIIHDTERNRQALSLEPVDLRELCEAAIRELRDSDVAISRIKISSDDNLPGLMLDARRARYAIVNLLSNALKFSDQDSDVLLELFVQKRQVCLRVSDSGIGIPPKDQPQIFDPFYRARNVGTVAGTGLGLSVVKEIVGLHDGTVELESEEGRGTTVTIVLPLHNAATRRSYS